MVLCCAIVHCLFCDCARLLCDYVVDWLGCAIDCRVIVCWLIVGGLCVCVCVVVVRVVVVVVVVVACYVRCYIVVLLCDCVLLCYDCMCAAGLCV